MNNLRAEHMFQFAIANGKGKSVAETVWYEIAYFRLRLTAEEVVMGMEDETVTISYWTELLSSSSRTRFVFCSQEKR